MADLIHDLDKYMATISIYIYVSKKTTRSIFSCINALRYPYREADKKKSPNKQAAVILKSTPPSLLIRYNELSHDKILWFLILKNLFS